MVKAGGKYLRYSRPVRGRGFVAPNFSRGTFSFMRAAGKLYLRLGEGVASVRLDRPELLVNAYRQFQKKEKRLVIAFRHSSRMDAPVLLYVISRILHKQAKLLGEPFPEIPHARFLYGKDVLNWAGKAAVWLFPRIGNIPVVNGEPNKEGLSLLREELHNGKFPIALAPEGQVTYHMHQCYPIASGTASLARWGLESGKDVLVLPVAIGYKYSEKPLDFTRKVLRRWEKQTGFRLERTSLEGSAGVEQDLRRQLIESTHLTLSILETQYRIPFSEVPDKPHSEESGGNEGLTDLQQLDILQKRIMQVCEAVLTAAEELAGLKAQGTWLDRVFRIRYAGVRRLYPEHFDPSGMPLLQRKLADYHSMEARIYLRHSQIVDVLEYLDPGYINLPCQPQRFCEYALNLLDIVNRMEGGDISTRYSPKGVQAFALPGHPISAADHFSGTAANGGRTAQKQLTGEIFRQLQKLSEKLIIP